MPVRHKHRIGRHLVMDEQSGHTYYDDEVVRIWDGSVVHRKHFETRQPQEFVTALADPYPVEPNRPDNFTNSVTNLSPATVGNTNTPAPQGPAYHLYVAIGNMAIGSTFKVS